MKYYSIKRSLLLGLYLFVGTVANAKLPQRIATTFIGADVIVYDLLKGAEEKRLVAVSPLGTDQRYSPRYQELKGYQVFTQELETVAKLKPDLIITARFTRADWLFQLEQLDIETLKLEAFASVADMKSNILTIGKAIGRRSAAKSLVNKMEQDLLELKKTCSLTGKRILNYGADGTLYGLGTSFDDLFKQVGAINVASDMGIKGWAKTSREQLAIVKVDYVIAAGEPDEHDAILKRLRQSLGWSQLSAVQHGHLILVPSRYLSSVTHWAVKALEIACAYKTP